MDNKSLNYMHATGLESALDTNKVLKNTWKLTGKTSPILPASHCIIQFCYVLWSTCLQAKYTMFYRS